MAWGRKKGGARREPMFGLAASLAELRLGPQDRVTVAEDKPKSKPAKRKPPAPERDGPAERKPRGAARRKSKTRARGMVYRLFYWGAVLGLWAGIAVGGVVGWVGAH